VTTRSAVETPQTAPATASSERVLELFLRALMAARKSVGLYPAGSEISSTWVRRLHRSLGDFFQQGLCFPLRVEPDRFVWAGPDMRTVEPVLEAFRFDLESRGIRELEIDASVEEWELQALLELLNLPGDEVRQLGGALGFLSMRGVSRVRIGAPGDRQADPDPNESTRRALQTGRDAVDLFVETVIGLIEGRFTDLTYERTALTVWLRDLASEDAGRLYRAVRTIHGLVEQAPDREVRTRTLVEALLGLPPDLLRPLFTDHLIPQAGQEVLALNLLSQMTEDEVRQIGELVPQESLLTLSSTLLEFPWEETQRRRVVEAITQAAVRNDETTGVPPEEVLEPVADDPLVAELRAEILAACQPDVLLERSTDILLALVLMVDGEEYATSAAEALQEILGEALARGRLELATRVLSTLDSTVQGGARSRERVQHLASLQQRLGSRTHVALLGGLLRQHGGNERHLDLVAQYLGLVAREALQEFTALLADERDRQVRARMCQVLVKVGRPAVPVLLDWLEDSRWFLVRNLLHVLGKIGDEGVFGPVVALLGHPHARVRVEAVRALARIDPGRAVASFVGLTGDPDPEVRLEVVRALGALRCDEAVPILRDVATGAEAAAGDLTLRRQAVEALAVIGTTGAQGVLADLAGRRVWFWRRAERQLRDLAASALAQHANGTEPGDE
jgi:HEAT repeats